MPKKDKYAHVTDEALKKRLVKLDEGQGWTETDPLYKSLQKLHREIMNDYSALGNTPAAKNLRNLMPFMWARKAQQMRLRRHLTTFLKRLGKYDSWRTGYGFELIDELEELQQKFKEWQKEVEELLNGR